MDVALGLDRTRRARQIHHHERAQGPRPSGVLAVPQLHRDAEDEVRALELAALWEFLVR